MIVQLVDHLECQLWSHVPISCFEHINSNFENLNFVLHP